MSEMTRINLRLARLIFDVAANVFVAGIAAVALWIEAKGLWTHRYAAGWETSLLIAWLTAILWVTLMPPLKGQP